MFQISTPKEARGPFGVGRWKNLGTRLRSGYLWTCYKNVVIATVLFLYQLAYDGELVRLIHILELSYKGKHCIAGVIQGTIVSVLWPPRCFHLFRLMKSSWRPHTLKWIRIASHFRLNSDHRSNKRSLIIGAKNVDVWLVNHEQTLQTRRLGMSSHFIHSRPSQVARSDVLLCGVEEEWCTICQKTLSI